MRIELTLILIILVFTKCKISDPKFILKTGSEFRIDNEFGLEFSNSAFIDSICLDKKLILIGELDHGDGSSFVVKSNLIKYLHEEKGFNTLILEASQINCFFLMNNIDSTENIYNITKESIHHIWSQVEETKMLFEYIQSQNNTIHPLKLIGIDPQFSGTARHSIFINELSKILPEKVLSSKDFQIFEEELDLMSNWLQFPNKSDHIVSEQEFGGIIMRLESQILNLVIEEDLPIWRLFFENIKVLASIKWFKGIENSFEIRDKQMFNNLNWYLNNHPNEKCIVWAANGHLIRKGNELKGGGPTWKGVKKLGDFICDNYGNKSYSIGITAFKGKTSDWFSKKNDFVQIRRPGKNSIEHKMRNYNLFLVDLNLFESTHQVKNYEAQLLYSNIRCTSTWSKNFDGVIFIKTMSPSTKI